jgi:hypothetical protein
MRERERRQGEGVLKGRKGKYKVEKEKKKVQERQK